MQEISLDLSLASLPVLKDRKESSTASSAPRNRQATTSKDIIRNLFVRLQAEKELGLQGNDAITQQVHASTLSKCLTLYLTFS